MPPGIGQLAPRASHASRVAVVDVRFHADGVVAASRGDAVAGKVAVLEAAATRILRRRTQASEVGVVVAAAAAPVADPVVRSEAGVEGQAGQGVQAVVVHVDVVVGHRVLAAGDRVEEDDHLVEVRLLVAGDDEVEAVTRDHRVHAIELRAVRGGRAAAVAVTETGAAGLNRDRSAVRRIDRAVDHGSGPGHGGREEDVLVAGVRAEVHRRRAREVARGERKAREHLVAQVVVPAVGDEGDHADLLADRRAQRRQRNRELHARGHRGGIATEVHIRHARIGVVGIAEARRDAVDPQGIAVHRVLDAVDRGLSDRRPRAASDECGSADLETRTHVKFLHDARRIAANAVGALTALASAAARLANPDCDRSGDVKGRNSQHQI